MADVPLPFGKSVLDRPNQAIEKHPLTSRPVYARYSAPGDSLRSALPSPEEHREKNVEKECHNKGDASDHECALNKAIEAFAGDRVNDGINDSSDNCAHETLPERSNYIVPIHNSLSLMILPCVLEC